MATQRFSLVLESRTTGTQEVAKLEDALKRVSDIAERSGKRTEDSAKRSADAFRKGADNLKQQAADIRGAITNPLETAGTAVESFALRFGKVGLLGTAVTAGLTAATAAAFALTKQTGDAAEQMLNLADRTGLTVAQIDILQAQAKIAGVNVQSLETAGRVLANSLSDVTGESSKAQVALERLGVSAFDAKGKQRELGQVTFEVIERLAGVKNQLEQVALANATLGRSSQEILPLIRNYEETKRAVQELGFGMDEFLIKKLAGSADEIDKLALRWELLKRQLAVPASAVVEIIAKVVGAVTSPEARQADALSRGIGAKARGGFADPFGGDVLGFKAPVPLPPRNTIFDLGLDAAIADQQARQQAAERARGQFGRTGAGQRQRLQELSKEISESQAKLFSPLDASARSETEIILRRAEAEKRNIEAALKATGLAADKAEELRRKNKELAEKQLQYWRDVLQHTPGRQAGRPEMFGPEGQIVFQEPSLFRSGESRGDAGQARARAEGIAAAQTRANERQLQVLTQEVDLQAQKISLLTGPGGEIAAINQITALRLASLEKQKQLGGDLFQIQMEQYRVQQEHELQILEFRKQQREETRRSGEALFDAALAGGGGLKRFALSQVLTPARTAAGNLAVELFGGSTGKLQLPGLTDAGGKPNLAGRLLSGTPFGIDPLKAATDLNTQATMDNTAALRGIPGGGGTAGVGSILSGMSGTNPLIFHGLGGGGGGDILSQVQNQQRGTRGLESLFGIKTSTGGGLARGVGIAGLLGGAAFGAYSGFSAGGVQGALTGSSSLLGGAAGLLPLLGVAGPLAPILGAGALGLAGISALMGDPKKKEAERIDKMLEGARYTEGVGRNYFTDVGGAGLDYNMRGQIRVYNTNVNVAVQTMDARSFDENGDRIIGAWTKALKNGQGGDTLDTIRQGM